MTATATGIAEQFGNIGFEYVPVLPDAVLATHSDVFGENPLAARSGSHMLQLGSRLSSLLGFDCVERQMVAHCSNSGDPWILHAFAVEPEGGGLVSQEAFQTTHPNAFIAGIVLDGVIDSPDVVIWRHARVRGGTLRGSTVLFDESSVHDSATIIDSTLHDKAYASDWSKIIRSSLENMSRVHNTATISSSRLRDFAYVRGASLVVDSKLSGAVIISGNPRIADSFVSDNARVNGEPAIVGSHLKDHILIEGTPRITNSLLRGESRVIQRARIIGSRLFGKSQATGDSVVDSSDLFGSATHDAAVVVQSRLANSTVQHHATVRNSTIVEQTIGDWVNLDGCSVSDNVALSDHVQALRAQISNRAALGGNARVVDSTISGKASILGDAVIRNGSTITDASVVTQQAEISSTSMFGRSIARGTSRADACELEDAILQDIVSVSKSKISNSEISDYAKILGDNTITNSRLQGAVQVTACTISESTLSGNFILSGADISGKHLNHACDPTNPKDDALFHRQTDYFLGPDFDKASCKHFTCERCNGPIYWKPAAGTHFLSDRL